MSEPRLISPLLDGFVMGDPISDHNGVKCCPAMELRTEKKYIVKVISIPASQKQLDALLLTGAYASKDEALAYFAELTNAAVAEAQLLQQLSRLEGFAEYTAWQTVPMDAEEGMGFDLYLLSPYRSTLEKLFKQECMTHLGAVNLGLDLCSALSVCRRNGHLYVDLKPGNIFLTEQGHLIGDLGFIALDSLKYASLPEKYHSAYTAPEVTDAYSALNDKLDIYAVGLILYQAYNNNTLPVVDGETGTLPPPAYADYEMAEIILKACAADPNDRWNDPVEMGQALVSYLQRNTVNDDPIIPPAVPEIPEEPQDDELAEEAQELSDTEISQDETEAADAVDEPQIEEEFLPEEAEADDEDQIMIDGFDADETVPSEDTAAELDDTAVSEEVSEMLAQADELIAHETPDPVVVPEPIDVPVPALPQQEQEIMEDAADEDAEALEETAAEEIAPAAAAVAVEAEQYDAPVKQRGITNKQYTTLIGVLSVILVLLLLAIGGFFFYEEYYLQPIDDLKLLGSENRLTVLLDTDVDNSLLEVVCTDTYGNKLTRPVENNKASFSDLKPGTKYTVTVQISGLHQLVGTTASSYTTAQQTNIVDFTAVTGDQDGTVILNFSVQGPENTAWRIRYSAPGVEEKEMPCTAHMAVITGLEVGKTYTFQLVSTAELYIVGNDTLEHTVSKVVYPENLRIEGFEGGALKIKWDVPADVVVDSWTVRCYNTSGFDSTITVTEPGAVFEGLDNTLGYTVDVKAAGMSESAQVTVSANSVTITSVTVDDSQPGQLKVSWEYDGTAPANGWRLLYTVDGSENQLVSCQENSCIISPVVPGGQYLIHFELDGGVSLFNGQTDYAAPEASSFNNYKVNASGMTFNMCRTPDKAGWDRNDIKKSDYTTAFSLGEKASFVVKLSKTPAASDDSISTLFVIRDSNGVPVAINAHSRSWNSMWDGRYCQIEMPVMPQAAGSYSVEIYLDGAHAYTQNFTIG